MILKKYYKENLLIILSKEYTNGELMQSFVMNYNNFNPIPLLLIYHHKTSYIVIIKFSFIHYNYIIISIIY